MKPAAFEYFAPRDVEQTLELLERYGDDAKVLAGGQSLMPLMNLRLARPKVIIDINRLSDLDFISANSAGELSFGALTRQRTVERSAVVREQSPLIAAVVPLIGHFQIRNRGTLGGSIVHADPAAELPAASMLLKGEFTLRSTAGTRKVTADEFYLGYLATAIQPGELLTEIRFPPWNRREAWGIEEVARRKGDFALVGTLVRLELDAAEVVQDIGIIMFGIGGKPERMVQGEALVKGHRLDDHLVRELSRVIAEELEPDSDIHASAQYRKEVGGVLARRALQAAYGRLRGIAH
jgi:CO/xanthine dehydrogenase FAD-binding subunit